MSEKINVMNPMTLHEKLKELSSKKIYEICGKVELSYPTVMKLKNDPNVNVNLNTIKVLSEYFDAEVS